MFNVGNSDHYNLGIYVLCKRKQLYKVTPPLCVPERK